MITSVDDPPNWNPKLPPSMPIAAGELHPYSCRHIAYPRPYLPPNRNAPLMRLGTITMHCALSIKSRGIPRSGLCMISVSANCALRRRGSGIVSWAHRAVVASVASMHRLNMTVDSHFERHARKYMETLTVSRYRESSQRNILQSRRALLPGRFSV